MENAFSFAITLTIFGYNAKFGFIMENSLHPSAEEKFVWEMVTFLLLQLFARDNAAVVLSYMLTFPVFFLTF